MNIDLISREELFGKLCEDTKEGTFEFTESQAEAADKIVYYVVKIIQDIPSVNAVPLDKLCEWLAGNAWHLDCSDCDAEHCDCPQWHDDSGSSPAFQKAKLTKWMEEQDAAD